MKYVQQLKNSARAPVSVIIPCYQAGKFLARAVNSVLKQSLQVSEIIIVNDGSTDNTLNIANKFAFDHKDLILVISFNFNKGVSVARNAGWNAVSQKYIAFLDADDTWHPSKIEIQYNFFLSNPNCALVGHNHYIKLTKSNVLVELFPKKAKAIKLSKIDMLLFTPFATPTAMLKTEISYRFNPNMKFAEDYLLWLQIVFSGQDVRKILMPLTTTYKFDYGQYGLSRDLIKMEKGVHQAYFFLFRDKLITRLALIFIILFSTLKFFIRVFVSFIRNLSNA